MGRKNIKNYNLKNMQTSDFLRSARLRKGLTQIQVSSLAHIPVRSYQRYESGERIPDNELLEILATALCVPVSSLKALNVGADDFGGFLSTLMQLEWKDFFSIEDICIDASEAESPSSYTLTTTISPELATFIRKWKQSNQTDDELFSCYFGQLRADVEKKE